MSFPRELEEIPEDELRTEIERRRAARMGNLCDYCGREPNTPVCKFPGRHRRDTRKDIARPVGPDDQLHRLCLWLAAHPVELGDVARQIRLPLPTCEGFEGPCENIVLWMTPGMTAYPWDGEGEDPNRSRPLCPECSAGYVEHWKDRWDEYHAGLL